MADTDRDFCAECKIGFFFFLSSASLTFRPEGVIVGFRNFAWGFMSQTKQKIGVKQYLGTPCPPGGLRHGLLFSILKGLSPQKLIQPIDDNIKRIMFPSSSSKQFLLAVL